MRARPEVLISILLLGFVASAAERPSLVVRAGYFQPTDSVFRTIYGGGISGGVEGALVFSQVFEAWAGAGLFFKNGHLIPTGERTTLWLVPAGAGLRYILEMGRVNVYAGAGVVGHFFWERTPIGDIFSVRPGPRFEAGSRIPLQKAWFLDFALQYSTCRMKPADLEFNVGGWAFSVGVGRRL